MTHGSNPTNNSPIRVPDLDQRSGGSIPYLILGFAALALWLNWNRIPERWPIHWNQRGEPDGWSIRSPIGVFLPLIIGLFMCLVFELVKELSIRTTLKRKGNRLSEAGAQYLAALTRNLLVTIQIGLALVFVLAALVLPLGRPARPGPMILSFFVVMALAVGFGLIRWWKRITQMKQAGLLDQLEGWHGLLYKNEADPRLWVPKITGVGYTLNFARREAWLIFVLFASLPILIVILVLALYT
jgi:uncharacterized membrane protein